MKWNDIRDRLKKSSNSVMESFKPESMMVNNSVGAGGVPVSSMKKTDFKKVIFPLVVAVVIVAGVIAIYFVLKNKNILPGDDLKLNKEEVAAVNTFFEQNPPQPLDQKDVTAIQNILDPQPEVSVEKTPVKPTTKK